MRLLRDQQVVSVGLSSVKLAGPNMKRKALLIGAPIPNSAPFANASAAVAAADTSTGGVKLTYTVPAGRTATLTFASSSLVAGPAPTVTLQAILGGVTVTLAGGVVPQTFLDRVPLKAGDTVRWNVTVVQVASTTDFVLGIEEELPPVRVTLGFNGPAVLDQGITIYAGTLPLQLVDEFIGEGIREDVTAIASQAATNITVVDIFTA